MTLNAHILRYYYHQLGKLMRLTPGDGAVVSGGSAKALHDRAGTVIVDRFAATIYTR